MIILPSSILSKSLAFVLVVSFFISHYTAVDVEIKEVPIPWSNPPSPRPAYNFTAHWERIQWENRKKKFTVAEEATLSSTQCSNEDASRIAAEFIKLKHDESECFSEDFLSALLHSDPVGDKLMINIGVNKGYNLGAWTAIFFPKSNLSGAIWQSMVCTEEDKVDVYTAVDCCGICKDCKQTYHHLHAKTPLNLRRPSHHHAHSAAKKPPSITTFIAWDLNNYNLKRIADAMQSSTFQSHLQPALLHPSSVSSFDSKNPPFSSSSRHYLELFTVHAAGSNVLGEAKIPDCGFGNEWCSLDPANKQPPPQWIGSPKTVSVATQKSVAQLKNTITVPLATVDHVMCAFGRQHRPSSTSSSTTSATSSSTSTSSTTANNSNDQHQCVPVVVDLLQIDTEGNDALVIQGSFMWLQRNLVRMLIFEYHSMQPWPRHALKDVVSQLDSFGYDCYFLGKTHLWRVSRHCWHDTYEFHSWANVMCVRRRDVWWHSVQPFVKR